MVNDPTLYPSNGSHRGMLVWKWTSPVTTLSSAPVGGGLNRPDWLLNIGVPHDYDRTDLEDHVKQTAAEIDLAGTGAALFTAVNVARFQRSMCGGVMAHATVGIAKPTWAADPTGGYSPWMPGTINLVIQLPVGLEPAAAVNAVITATEAKTQALHEQGVPGTGTASDAVVIVWPTDAEAELFAGPRSEWGARIAQASYAAVLSGIGTPR
ncbi:MAG: adenosylcobinamide hydrolase [Acidimicrobiales bacterium]|jgi:adenosylcobinamide hydrolase